MDKDLLQVLDKLHNDSNYRKYEEQIIDTKFNEIKTEILAEFDNHPITREIEAGITAQNTSGTLNGITNLYSFIGFEAGDEPTTAIRILLEKSRYRMYRTKKGSISTVTFFIPTAAEIFAETPMPWAVGRSWAKGIESGISGLGYYLKKARNSRSGLGIQTQNLVREGFVFKNTKYISNIINNFNNKLKAIDKLIV